MITLSALVAASILLAPYVGLALLRAKSERSIGSVAAWLGAALAADLLGILMIARAMSLERAAWTARGLWAVGLLLAWRRRASSEARPSLAVSPAARWSVIASSAAALGLSLLLSRPYAIWDRLWHIPLVSVLRAQRVPFVNVYDPATPLHYHFSGDVLAALVQVYSFDVLHASHALSLAHDALYACLGAMLGAWLSEIGVKRAVAAAASTALVLLTGPVTLFAAREPPAAGGQTLFSLLSLSFRPHVALAFVLLFTLWIAITKRSTAITLVASAALAITDESSLVLVGLALGGIWLVAPAAIAPKRWMGAAVLGAMGALFLGVNALFRGAFAWGAPRFATAFVTPRLPGYDSASLPLASSKGVWIFAAEAFPIWMALLAMALAWPRLPLRDKLQAAGLALLTAMSAALFVALEVNRSPIESHRFMTAPLFFAPIVALTALARADVPFAWNLSTLALAAGLWLPAMSTSRWLAVTAPTAGEVYTGFFSPVDFQAVDCRKDLGAKSFESSERMYAEKGLYYLVAGCRPTFTPSPTNPNWSLQVKAPWFGRAALAELDRWQSGRGPTITYCAPGSRDDACLIALSRRRCAPSGALARRCELAEIDRRAALGSGKKW